MPFNSETGYLARCRLHGLLGGPKRAAFWRELGFPNLVGARKARWKGHVLKATQRAAEAYSPFAILDDLPGDDRKRPDSLAKQIKRERAQTTRRVRPDPYDQEASRKALEFSPFSPFVLELRSPLRRR